MPRFATLTAAAALASAALLAAPLAYAQSHVFGNGVFWTHNNSWMTISKSGRSVRIRYDEPRPGIRRHGVRRGTTLFRGRINGSRLRGTAYIFKRGCQPASYNVSGRLSDLGSGAYSIVLRGASPIREGCEVVGYTRNSSNARLVFRFAGTGD